MISYWHHNVCPSVCIFVTLCIVAKRYILWQKCVHRWIGSAILGTWRYNFQPPILKLPPPKFSTQCEEECKRYVTIIMLTWHACRSRDTVYIYIYYLQPIILCWQFAAHKNCQHSMIVYLSNSWASCFKIFGEPNVGIYTVFVLC